MASQPVPAVVKLTVVLVLVQVLFLVGTTVSGIITATDVRSASVVGSFFLLVAISLAVGAGALWKRQRFSRALILVWQLFAVIIGVQTALSGALLQGLGATLISGAVVILMFTRPALAHTEAPAS